MTPNTWELSSTPLPAPHEDADITAFLHQTQALLYHSPGYLRLVAQNLSAQAFYLQARDATGIKALLPYLVKSGPLGPVFNSCAYFGSNGGILSKHHDPQLHKALCDDFFATAVANQASCATLITNPLDPDQQAYADHIAADFIDQRIGQITAFPTGMDSEQALLDCFEAPRPRNIRKARKSGILVETNKSAEALQFLIETHQENIRAIGGVTKRASFFTAIEQHIPDDQWQLFIGKLEGQPVAALLLFYFNGTVEYFTPCIDSDYRHTQALSLVIFEAMKAAIAKGYHRWNWGGTWLSQDGVYNFKKKWGTSDHPYFYHTRLFNAQVLRTDKRQLLEHYPGFFTVPFQALKTEEIA